MTGSAGRRVRRRLLDARGPARVWLACPRCRAMVGLRPRRVVATLVRPPVVWLPWRPTSLLAACGACRHHGWLGVRLAA